MVKSHISISIISLGIFCFPNEKHRTLEKPLSFIHRKSLKSYKDREKMCLKWAVIEGQVITNAWGKHRSKQTLIRYVCIRISPRGS